jgi:hypothetical protein
VQKNDATSANIHAMESLHMDSHAMTDLRKPMMMSKNLLIHV